jgi:hypothetical protein
MKIGWVLFSNYHQRKDIGSSRIRGEWVSKYLKDSEIFIQGGKYDCIIFQKVYWKEMIENYKGFKIFDICDPDYLQGQEVMNIFNNVDCLTVPTKKMYNDLVNLINKPIYIIPDRVDLEVLGKPKKTVKQKAKKVVWFGYSNNLEVLYSAFYKLKRLDLKIRIITDCSFHTSECKSETVKWEWPKVINDIKECDFAIFPEYNLEKNNYKSNNKDVLSWACGLPVAKTASDVERFLDWKEREKERNLRLEEVRNKYDVKLSANQFQEIINTIK